MQAVLKDGLCDFSKCPHDHLMAVLKFDPGILQRVPDSQQQYFRWALLHEARGKPFIFSPETGDVADPWAYNPLAWDGAWEDEENFLVQAVRKNPALIHYIPDAFRGRLFVREAVAANAEVIKHCLSAPNAERLVVGALEKTPEAAQALPEEWHDDFDLLAAAISANPKVCNWIPSSSLQGNSSIFLNAISDTWKSRSRLKKEWDSCCERLCWEDRSNSSDGAEQAQQLQQLWNSGYCLIIEYFDKQGLPLDWAEHFIEEPWGTPSIPNKEDWCNCLDSFTVGKHVRILEQALQYLGESSDFPAEAL